MRTLTCGEITINLYEFDIFWTSGWDADAGEVGGKTVKLLETDSLETARLCSDYYRWDAGNRYGRGVVVILDSAGDLVGDPLPTRRLALAI